MHRVLVNGPVEQPTLMLVLLNVADWSDTDIGERGHAVSQVVIAARCGISLRYCRKLMADAVTDGWLTLTRKPRPGRMGLWKLGPNLSKPRVSSARSFPNDAQPARGTSRSLSAKKHIDVDVDLRKGAAPANGAGVGPPPGRADGAVRGASAPKTDVPPPPPETVDKPAAQAHLAAARGHLAGPQPATPPEPDDPVVAAPLATVLAFQPKGQP
jgi:hypothetical protein